MCNQQYNELERCLRAIGVTSEIPESASWPVFEDDYMKFMMGAPYEELACDGFEAWLKANAYSYERHRDRAVRNLDPRAVDRIHVLWRIRPQDDECQDATFPLPLDWDLYRDNEGDWCLLAPEHITLVSEPLEPLLLEAETLTEAIAEAVSLATQIA